MTRNNPDLEKLSADFDALTAKARSWIEREFEIDGHIVRRMMLAAHAGVRIDERGDETDPDFERSLTHFNSQVLISGFNSHDPDIRADAAAVICAIAAACLERGVEMPFELQHPLHSILSEQFQNPPLRRRGRHTFYDNWARDSLIYLLVRDLQNLGLQRTRGRYPSPNKPQAECAYSVAAKLLTEAGHEITEDAVRQAWEKGKGWGESAT